MCLAVTQGYRRRIIRNQPIASRATKLRSSTVSIYAGAFLLVISFLALVYESGGVSYDSGSVSATQSAVKVPSSNAPEKISIEQLAAASAATSLAETVKLPAAGDLREATTTLYIKKQLSQNDAEVISKPQIVQPTTSTERGITSYVTKEGDSLETVARQFNISTQTLRWANNTTSDAVEVGKTLVVPQTDGVVYTVKEGDTVEAIATKYKVDAERVVLYNDLEADAPLVKDARIVLPSGDLPETERPGYVAPRPAYTYSSGSSYSGASSWASMGGGSILSRSYGFPGPTSGNRYAGGNCTWYAYERRAQLGRPIGGMWGNAYSWASSARGAGYSVGSSPAVGAVIQTSGGGGGYGHVGVVERIEDDGIVISDMNYAGYNVVTWRKIPASQVGSYQYIY